MARRIYLHIGAMKSATTYVQKLCNANPDALSEAGIYWGGARVNFLAINQLLGVGNVKSHPDAWQKLNRAVRQHDGDAFVSNEILSLRSQDNVCRVVEALAPAEVHLILTARDLGRVIPSQWQEGTRARQTVTWTDMLDALTAKKPDEAQQAVRARFWRRQNLPQIIAKWSPSIPVERITLVTVPPHGAPTSLIAERMASVVGFDPTVMKEPAEDHSGLGAHSAELMRRLNESVTEMDRFDYRKALHAALAREVLASRKGQEPTIVLPTRVQKWARTRAKRMVADVRESHVRVVGDLDDLIPLADPGRPSFDPGGSSDGELLDAALWGLAGLANKMITSSGGPGIDPDADADVDAEDEDE